MSNYQGDRTKYLRLLAAVAASRPSTRPTAYCVDSHTTAVTMPPHAYPYADNLLFLSIIPDQYLGTQFSELKLVIVTDVPTLDLYEVTEEDGYESSHLGRIRDQSSKIQHAKKDNGSLPVPTLVFRIITTYQLEGPGIAKIYHHYPGNGYRLPLWNPCFLIEKYISTSSAGTVILRSNYQFFEESFLPEDGDYDEPYALWKTYHLIPVQSNLRKTSRLHSLPREVLHNIAHQLCDEEFALPLDSEVFPGGTPSQIRTVTAIYYMSLVCTAWRSVIQVCFEQVGRCGHELEAIDIRRLMRSLRLQPDMIRFMQNYSQYQTHSQEDTHEFIVLCPMIRILSLQCPLPPVIRSTLPTLKHVGELELTSYSLGDPNVASIIELYDIIQTWEKLEHLRATVSGPTWLRDPDSRSALRPYSARFSLKSLSIQSNRASSHAFSDIGYLFQPDPTLESLKLSDIDDLSNRELRAVLIYLGPTLKRLQIRHCSATVGDHDGEAALDAAVPYLSNIRFITVSGSFCTALTLSRKVKCRGHGMEEEPCCKIKWKLDGQGSQYTDLNAITQALKVTGWQHIILDVDNVLPEPDTDSVDDSDSESEVSESSLEDDPTLGYWIRIAKRRNIQLDLDFVNG